MATIREMATLQEVNVKDRASYEKGYTDGANAVLAKIEKALDMGEPPYLISAKQAYYKTKRCVKELKGE